MNKLIIPSGLKDYYGDTLIFKKHIEHLIHKVFKEYNYTMVSTPSLEFANLYEGKDTFQVLDNNELLSLRYDMTPSIARLFSTYFKKTKPSRFCYIENSFRTGNKNHGILREFTQAGAELIGVNSLESTSEILVVAINSLLNTGLVNFKINVGNTNFITSILNYEIKKGNLFIETAGEIKKELVKGNFIEPENIILNSKCEKQTKEIFSKLPRLTGSLEILEEIDTYTEKYDQPVKESITSLKELYELLENYDVSDFINFDLSITGEQYYTGIIFHGYCQNVGQSIVDGGRYNNMLKEFGVDLPAVGFAININGLLDGLYEKGHEEPNKTLVIINKGSGTLPYKIMEGMRNEGKVLELYFGTLDKETIKDYCINNDFGGVLHFIDKDKCEVLNISTMNVDMVDINQML
ncbi:MAG: ATP phosphoribosyltransferase regulatory subunit [Lachnospirales bacterium]